MSLRCASARKISRPSGRRRSSARLRLLRLTVACMNESGGCVPGRCGGTRRAISPSGCSTLITSAPRSASRHAHIGPAQVVVTSTTRRPASGPGRSARASRKNASFSRAPPPVRAPTGPAAHAFAARRAAPPPARWYNLGSVREPVWEGSMADLGQLLVTRSPALVDLALLVGRLAIGVCFAVHGLGKLGLVGTGNMDGFVAWLRELGVFMRPACLLLVFTMIVAGRIGHRGAGYLITNDPPGAEYTINLAVICACFALAGPGAFSLDALLFG